jgi:hypothetical protein
MVMTIRIRFEVTYGMARAKKPSRSSDSSEPASNTSWLEAITVEVRVEEPLSDFPHEIDGDLAD